MAELNTKIAKYSYALGRRKTSVATVRLFEGKGESEINQKQLAGYFPLKADQHVVLTPLRTVDKIKDYYFTAKVRGGGKKSQREAVSLGIARALVKLDKDYKPQLKKLSLLTRDDRMVERKKTGLVKARKAPQYSKR